MILAFVPSLPAYFQRLDCNIVTVSAGRNTSASQTHMFPWTLTGYALSRTAAVTTAFPPVVTLNDCGTATPNACGNGKFRANPMHS